MKRVISLLLCALLALAPAAFSLAEEDWFFSSDGFSEDPHGFAGEYADTWSQRAGMYIFYNEDATDGNPYVITINWSDSAFQSVEWYMTGRYEYLEGDCIISTNCQKTLVSYADEFDLTLTTLYTDGECCLTLADGILYWQDGTENAGKECRFEKIDEQEFFSDAEELEDWRLFYNPNGYDVLYITDVFDVDGTAFVFGCFGTLSENGVGEHFNPMESMAFPLSSGASILLPENPAGGEPVRSATPVEWFENARAAGINGFYASFTMKSDGSLSALTYLSAN